MLKFIALLAVCGIAQATVPLQQPTVTQVDPSISCTNSDINFVAVSSTGINGAYLVGKAQRNAFSCKLRVHSGRGGGIRIVSMCANMIWDFNGAIVSVTPTLSVNGYSVVCP
jgi:hypothetical protein